MSYEAAKPVTLHLTDSEAQEILFALACRSKHSKLSAQGQERAEQLGKHLNVQFENYLGWDKWDRIANMRKPIKRMTLTMYDFPPND